MSFYSKEDNSSISDFLYVLGFMTLIFFIICYMLRNLGNTLELLFIFALSIMFALIIGYLSENLWLARRATYIFFISGWFISISLERHGFPDFLFGSYIGVIGCSLFTIWVFKKIIPYRLVDYSGTFLEYDSKKNILTESRNSLEFMGFESQGQYDKGYILGYETRVKFMECEKKLKIAIIAFYLDKSKIIQNESSDMAVLWLKKVLGCKKESQFKERDLTQEIATDILSDYIMKQKIPFYMYILPIVVMVIAVLLVFYRMEIFTFFDAHQWLPGLIVGLTIALLPSATKIYSALRKKKKVEGDEP